MKLRITLLTIVFGCFSMGAFAQQAQSDYKIQKTFKEKYEQYQNRIKTVSSLDSAQALIASVREFDQQYSNHSELLSKALYPDTYKERMEELKKSSVIAKNRLKQIREQAQKLEALEAKLAGYEKNINKLDQRRDSLKKAMRESIASEKKLSDMLRKYRNSLEQRDDLIMAFIDSMVVAYQQMDMEAFQDLENIDKKARVEAGGDALKMIHNIAVNNVDMLKQNSDKMRLQDYMRMAEVQQQFQKMWNRLGGKIREVYDGKNAEVIASEIDKSIREWNRVLKTRTLAAIQNTLGKKGIEVNSFQTSDQLYSALNSYLDKQIKQSRENPSKEKYSEYQAFQDFWNSLEVRWSRTFVDSGILSNEQMATLNQKVDQWSVNAQPKSNKILVYLFGLSVLLVVVLGVMLVREKKK